MRTFVLLLATVLLAAASVSAASFQLSNTLGDHMVLQRAPASAVVFGFADPGVVVRTTFNGTEYQTTTTSQGVWRQALPPTQAGGPYTISFSSSDGDSAQLLDVLFGEVFFCGGQSNCQMTMDICNNATAEIASANSYPNIRVFTVGQGTSSNTPLTQLGTIAQKWTSASSSSIGGPSWGYFSGLCWLFGKSIYQSLGGNVPVGLVSNNWGGTSIQQWCSACTYLISSTRRARRLAFAHTSLVARACVCVCLRRSTYIIAALKACNGPAGSNNLFNAMINPYVQGRMAAKGMIWYQGESNVGQASYYSCQFPVMIDDYRKLFKAPNMYFGFVQISGYNYGTDQSPAYLREAQLSALQLPNVGLASAVDVGMAFDIHPTGTHRIIAHISTINCTDSFSSSSMIR
mgnify:FL=1